MKYLMPTELDNGFTHCAMEPENLIEKIQMFFYKLLYKNIFKFEGKTTFCMIDTKWFKENVKQDDIGNGIYHG